MGRNKRKTRHGWFIVVVVLTALICLGSTAHAGWDPPGFFGTLTDRVTSIFDYATSATKGIAKIAANAGSLSFQLTTGFSKVLSDPERGLTFITDAVTSQLSDLVNVTLEDLKKHVQDQFGFACTLVGNLSTGMVEYLEELGSDLTLDFEIIGEMLGNLTGDLVDAAADLGEDVVEGISDVVGDLGDIDELIGRSFDNLGISLFDGFASTDQLIGEAISGQISSVETVLTSLGALVTDPEKMADIFLSLAELYVVMGIMPMEQALAMQEARLEQMCAVIETLPLLLQTLPGLVSGLQETRGDALNQVVEFAGNLPEWLSSIPDLVEGKLRGAADSLASDITQLVGFIPGMDGINTLLAASDRSMTELLAELTALADSIEQGFAQLEQQVALRGVLVDSTPTQAEPDDELLAYRAGLEAELHRIEQENGDLQAENERLLAARRADAWAMVMMAVQRETSIPALVPTEGASGGEAI